MPEFASERDIRRIAASVHAHERRIRSRLVAARGKRSTGYGRLLGMTNAEIPAMDGSLPGSGVDNVSIYTLNDAGYLEDTGEDLSAYNLASAAVQSGKMVVLSHIVGKWWVTVEDCTSGA